MDSQKHLHCTILAVSLSLFAAGAAHAQESTKNAVGQNVNQMKFVGLPGLPTCAKASVQNGDPSKEPSVILAKIATGCKIPWHWHTANENLMLVSGVARLETKDGKPLVLRQGGFARMPSRHIHQMHCTSRCMLYIQSDGAFDIHYVDAQDKEITPEEALKAVKETPAK